MLLPLIVAFLASPQVEPPVPPYRRVETVLLSGHHGEKGWEVAGSTLIIGGESLIAYALPDMHRKWQFKGKSRQWAGTVAVSGNAAFASFNAYDRGRSLVAFDVGTGSVRWTKKVVSKEEEIAVLGNALYAVLAEGKLSKLDAKTGAIVWTVSTPTKGHGKSSGDVILTPTPTGILYNSNGVTYGLNPANGKVVWIANESYVSEKVPFSGDVAWISSNNVGRGIQISTGKSIWTSKAGYDSGAMGMEGALFGTGNGILKALNPKDGSEIWSLKIGPANETGGDSYLTRLGNMICARGIHDMVFANRSGKVLWRTPIKTSIEQPIWTDGIKLICLSWDKLTAYKSGPQEQAPTAKADREKLATRLVRDIDLLDNSENELLLSLGSDAFAPVLEATLKAHHASNAAKGENSKLNELSEKLSKILLSISTTENTPALMDALAKAKPDGSEKVVILQILAQQGDPAIITPWFLKELEGVKTPGFEMYQSTSYIARKYIAKSKDPRAVAFMIRQLKDPKADKVMRSVAYFSVGAASDEGADAVLAERSHRTLIKPFAERVMDNLDLTKKNRGNNFVDSKPDASGKTWGLIHSAVLGSYGDFYLVEKQGEKWINPIFTGVSSEGVSKWVKPPVPEPTVGGKTGPQLAKSDWLALLATNKAIRVDTDGDGLTDLVEQRIGTDPKNPDSDGDGDRDDVDPWPTVGARPESDTEKALAAVFEAKYHFDEIWSMGLLTLPKGVKPFEMVGWRGQVVVRPTEAKAWSLPLEGCYEQGVAFISIDGLTESGTLIWGEDNPQPKVQIGTYYGGLNGSGYTATLRKYKGQWIVINMSMDYIS